MAITLSMAASPAITRIVVLGATQGVGQALLEGFSQPQWAPRIEVHAVSRQPNASTQAHLHWHVWDLIDGPIDQPAEAVISLGPIQYVTDYLASYPHPTPPQAVWALSSASTDFKHDSTNAQERSLMASILDREQALERDCRERGIHCQLFKTTLLYGRGDRNINRLAGLIRRLRWVPVVGAGLRAPVHVDDVATLIAQQLKAWMRSGDLESGVWRLQGGEVLTYPQMLQAIADARGLKCMPVRLPLMPLRWGLSLAHGMGGLHDIEASMLERQQQGLVVDDRPARARLHWQPRGFSFAQKR